MSAVASSGPAPPARLLDLTRLFSRVGRGAHTGVDRVEAAYLHRLLEDTTPLFSLVATPEGPFLLDRAGTEALAARLDGREPWGQPDMRAQLRRKASPAQRAARADLRRLALAHASKKQLPNLLRETLPAGTAWLNVGHSNLDAEVFAAVHAIPDGRATVLIHDMIPLDFPEYQRPETVATFARKMETVAHHADLVICNSEVTRGDAERHFAAAGRVPPMLVAHLGVSPVASDSAHLPNVLDLTRPWFVVLGTIEPRKNHALLLDIWDDLAETLPDEQMPTLVIVGRRGWRNEEVFRRLDTSPLMDRHILEFGDLDDAAVYALIAGARALLMPSLAEGFGLPPAEALALGTPVIAHDLPVYREVLGNNPVYVHVTDRYSWKKQILDLAGTKKKEHRAAAEASFELPTWRAHFNLVFKVT